MHIALQVVYGVVQYSVLVRARGLVARRTDFFEEEKMLVLDPVY